MLRQISSTMVGTKGKMYTEIKVKERRFLEFRNKRKERQTTEIVNQTPSRSRDCSDSGAEWKEFSGTSGKKMKMPSSPNYSYSELLESEDANDVLQGQGYRLIDIERFSSTLTEGHCFWRRCEFTWFCVTNLKSSFRGYHMNSRKHLFCTSGCISSINLKFSGLYPLTELSWISWQFLYKLNFK